MKILFTQKKTNNPISSLGSEELTLSLDLDDNSFTLDPLKDFDINRMLKEHSNDIELLVNDSDSFNTFKQKIQNDNQFTREVFRVFLKDILEV